LKTCGESAKQTHDLLRHVGVKGNVRPQVYGVGRNPVCARNGLEQIQVREKQMKSLGAEHTFEKDVEDKAQVLSKLGELVEKLHARVVSASVKFRVVGIRIRFTHFQTFSRENTLSTFASEKGVILSEAKNLLREFEKRQDKVRLIGVYVSDFRDEELLGESLESWVES
ncbi:MAG: hypothetical protein M1368_04720, partial [Thaumarchaeota archaeon]|nr:hypothetical protein [Nitrososphaerota archaeon]